MLIKNGIVRRVVERKAHRTLDRDSMRVLTTEQIGPKRAKTPEGFLLCLEVPVARTGEMIYGAGEVPVEAGSDGLIRITRDADTLFEESAIASYAGKPVVDDHPEGLDVNPDNWKKLTIGVVLNPRRGTGDDSDVMIADLLITDAQAIKDVESGKREVSAGYDAEYEQTAVGAGRQVNILGNHVALVDRGRCGPRCAIGDHQPQELKSMKKPTLAERIRRAFRDAENDMLGSLPGADPASGLTDEPDAANPDDGTTHIHIHNGGAGGDDPAATGKTADDPTEARFAAIESAIAEIKALLTPKPAADGPADADALAGADITSKDALPDEVEAAMKSKTGDSVALESSFKAVLADAEILVPGFRIPTFDAELSRKKTLDAMCGLRRAVIGQLAATNDGTVLINAANGRDPGPLDKLTCVQTATIFRAAAGAKRMLNNAANTRDAGTMPPGAGLSKPKLTLAELNKLHQKHHAQA